MGPQRRIVPVVSQVREKRPLTAKNAKDSRADEETYEERPNRLGPYLLLV
jgi:hypothetical protein